MRTIFLCIASITLLLGGCGETPRFDGPVSFVDEKGGTYEVSAENLNRGYELYTLNCYACHGMNGDGRGPAAAFLRPQPRDFRTGVFKFGLAMNGGAHTEDLVELVQRGLAGTAMLAWDTPEEHLIDIIHYIKTFSPKNYTCVSTASCGEGKCSFTNDEGEEKCKKPKKLGKRLLVSDNPDPWKGRDAEAIAQGERVYHINAQCRTCHPSYVTQKKFYDMTRGDFEWAYGELRYRSALKESTDFKGMKILPIDFLYHRVKNVNAGETVKEQRERLFRVIGSGINGAAMPTWKGSISDEDLWALSYYVQDVAALRGTPKARALRDSLTNQEPFTAPGAGTEEGTTEGESEGDGEGGATP